MCSNSSRAHRAQMCRNGSLRRNTFTRVCVRARSNARRRRRLENIEFRPAATEQKAPRCHRRYVCVCALMCVLVRVHAGATRCCEEHRLQAQRVLCRARRAGKRFARCYRGSRGTRVPREHISQPIYIFDATGSHGRTGVASAPNARCANKRDYRGCARTRRACRN